MRIRISALFLAALLAPALVAQTFELVPLNATWAFFKGRTEASSPVSAWRQRSFADPTWTRGAAPFFYGEALTGGTRIDDLQNSYSTLFLRREFVVTNLAQVAGVELDLMCDDGAIVWVNGTEALRYNAPAGVPAFNSLASANATPDPAVFNRWALPAPATLLVPGTNVMAAQVFNVSLASSDLVFEAALIATLIERAPPLVASVSPPPGPVDSLTQIEVRFSKPVTGVDAADLLLNDLGCLGVSGSGTTYTFACPPIPFGEITVSWDPRAGITDFNQPPVPFDPTGPGARWLYGHLDPGAPRLVAQHPLPGAAVRRLGEVEVVFDRSVTGVDAADLRVNGVPATNGVGAAAGPYRFEFPEPSAGEVRLEWAAGHGIRDAAGGQHAFEGGDWTCRVDPALPLADVTISEIMAENVSGLADEDGDREDWIELWNRGTNEVDLAGWSLTDDPRWPRQWRLPSLRLAAGQRLVIFASGKDRPGNGGSRRPHTNFKLSLTGEYLGLFGPESLRVAASELAPAYPEQRHDLAYGQDPAGQWRYFPGGTPGVPNGLSPIAEAVEPVHFSVPRGFFDRPFNLSLATPTPGATIRYTLDGSLPSLTNGTAYLEPIPLSVTRMIRASAFATNRLPSTVATHTYLFNLPVSRRRLPVLSLVTDKANLFGQTGIMESSPRNTTKHGLAWERPVSAELIRPEDNGGFQVDCGIRVQGGGYIRERYDYRSSDVNVNKYSFRLYFRGDYGPGRLEYPLFPGTTLESFDKVVLRAGMNDHTNPFLTDEFVRALAADCGQPAALGSFVHLFLNGVYKGYYNPCERIDIDFLRAYHGGGEAWDVIAQFGEVREGDAAAWESLKSFANTRDLSTPGNYLEIARRLDLDNFIDYLCPLVYVDADDWPHNNWRAARERVAGAPFRFYVWDAEWAFGVVNGHSPSWNTLANQLASTSPPWGSAEIQRLYLALKKAPEFRLRFADRVHRHFFNGGALTDDRIRARYEEVRGRLNNAVAGFNNRIGTTWIPQRRRWVIDHFQRAGLLASTNAPAFSRFGGAVPAGFRLEMTNLTGTIFFTTNGADPRVPFTGAVAPDATAFPGSWVIDRPVLVRARALDGTNWSALTEAAFEVTAGPLPLRIVEINYHPPGGDAYEFVELLNDSPLPLDVGGVSFEGLDFRFPNDTVLAPNARLVLASDAGPAAFAQRYPGVTVFGWFGGSLSNSGERLALLDKHGRTIESVTYADGGGWADAADGEGPSLERLDPAQDPDDPAQWMASAQSGGSPGTANATMPLPSVRLNELAADVRSEQPAGGLTNDWIELHNAGPQAVNLAGWSVSDGGSSRRFVFPSQSVPPGGYLVVLCATNAPDGPLRAGFALDRHGESLFLEDTTGRRIDAVTWGPQVAGFSLGRVGTGADWQLTEPTPGGANEPAALGSVAALRLNEFLADSPPGAPDWIELFNTDLERPVALAGVSIATSNAVFRIRSRAFVAPGGYAVFKADEEPGPDHLDLKLPSPSGRLALLDPAGVELHALIYRQAVEGVSQGFLPDDPGQTVVSFPNSSSPGAVNYQVGQVGPVINEVLARSRTNATDWIELFNPDTNAFNLGGFSLSVDRPRPGEWVFPAGLVIPAGAYRVIAADPARPASVAEEVTLNCGRALDGEGGGVHLFNRSGQVVDRLEYGAQLPDQSIGRTGSGWALLTAPTPGSANATATPLGDRSAVRLNEWLAAGGSDDWIELFNGDPLPVDLGGCLLTDDPSLSGRTNRVLRPLTLIAGGGWLKWIADGQPDSGPAHLAFGLNALGETIRLYAPDGTTIDSIDFLVQTAGVSEGRWVDGGTNLFRFDRSASPGNPNWLPLGNVVVNELLMHTDPPFEDAIELANLGDVPVGIGGWWLSDDPQQPRKFRIPDGRALVPGGYAVFYENQFGPPADPQTGFRLDPDRSGEVILSEVDATGALTGRRSVVRHGASGNGVSFGRYRTSVGDDHTLLSRRTFGVETPISLEQFRTGKGAANAYPEVGPVVIHEIMHHPVIGVDRAEDPRLEYVELHNLGSQPVSLGAPDASATSWRLSGGIDWAFGPTTIEAGGYRLVVGFDPARDRVALEAFLAHYRLPASAGSRMMGPYQGRLSNEGEEIRLNRPGEPVPRPGGGTFMPEILVDRVDYGVRLPWPAMASGTGLSLQRQEPGAYGNDPIHWRAGWPTPLAANASGSGDSDGDGLPDEWELAHGFDLASGEGVDGARGDPDDDGLSNLDEYLAGTDPRELSLVVTGFAVEGRSFRIGYNAAAGVRYRIEQASTPARGVWQTVAFIGPRPSSSLVERVYPLQDEGRESYFRMAIEPR